MKKQNQSGFMMMGGMLFLLFIIIVFAVLLVWRISDSNDDSSDESTAQIESQASNEAATSSAQELPDAIEEAAGSDESAGDTSQANEEAAPVETITLAAVNDYDAAGTATRTTEGEYVHTVLAQMGDPAEGKFYEGWIVGPSVISTGELTKESEGEWSLTYTSSEDLSQHTRVVITEETSANGLDGIPETHVLEGSF